MKSILLKRLKLKNLALIEIIEINFEKGLNVFTGESGSGKSLILDSLDSLFGGSNIPLNHLIRPDKSECLIEATFQSNITIRNFLTKNGFTIKKSEVNFLRKTFKKNEKILSKFELNGLPIKKSLLKELSYLLLDFTGQSDSLLFNSQNHLRDTIDQLGSQDLKNLNLKVKKTWEEVCFLKKDIALKSNQIKIDKNNYKESLKNLKILEDANLEDENEIRNLKAKQYKLSNNFELQNSLNLALSCLNNSESDSVSVNYLLSETIKQINKVTKFDNNLDNFSEKLNLVQNQVEDLIYLLLDYLQTTENEQDQLDQVQHRLFFLRNLEKSFSLDLSNLIKQRDHLRDLSSLTIREDEVQNLQKKLTIVENCFFELLKLQSEERKIIADKLKYSVTLTLKNLGLKNVKFDILFSKIAPNYYGDEELAFLFSANPDQPLAPISSVISGGEMSRFLLALKFNISNVSNTLFFDEIDNGLSGKSLHSLITLIKEMSKNKQILCITHHPILSSAADVHFKVEKTINNGTTFTSLSKLTTKKQKQEELIELIGGGYEEASNYALTLMERNAA